MRLDQSSIMVQQTNKQTLSDMGVETMFRTRASESGGRIKGRNNIMKGFE